MKTEENSCEKRNCHHRPVGHACGNAVYGLGVVGAAIYFIMQSGGFWMGVVGILKALVWPAILVFEALKTLSV